LLEIFFCLFVLFAGNAHIGQTIDDVFVIGRFHRCFHISRLGSNKIFTVKEGQKLFVHRLKANEGSEVEFEKVMLVDNDGKVTVGTPVVEGAKVVAEVLSHVKGDKVLVFKKKRRKGYQKLNGHRQQFSQIRVKEIIA
jgi:large subunit ribosomal protein L21